MTRQKKRVNFGWQHSFSDDLLSFYSVLLFLNNVKSGVNDIVASLNGSHSCGRKSHTDVLDNISGRKRKISHLLGVDLLGLGYDGDVSIIDSGIEECEET